MSERERLISGLKQAWRDDGLHSRRFRGRRDEHGSTGVAALSTGK
ncbi:MAG: hypothetical protein ABSG14_12065 [Verrucomicrobiia bacterium]